MPLTPNLAIELAEALSTMAEFPRFRGAVTSTAEDLIWLFRDLPDVEASVKASALVARVRREWETWLGTAPMVEFCHRVFFGKHELPPANQAVDYGVKPPIICVACNDTGVLYSVEPGRDFGYYAWCCCAQAEILHHELPDWLSTLNRRVAEPSIPPHAKLMLPQPPPVIWLDGRWAPNPETLKK
jgi:hypothetical protein